MNAEHQERLELTYDVQRSLGRIEGKLDSLASTFVAHSQDDHFNFQELNKRTSYLEKKLFRVVGVISFLALAVPSAIAYFK